MGSKSGERRPHYGKEHQFKDEAIVDHYYNQKLNLAQPFIVDGGKIESAMTRKSSEYERRKSMHTDHNQRRVNRESGKRTGIRK